MEYDIYINSSIGWPFSAEYVRQELNKYQGQPCNVYISSLGGSVLDAVQIHQMCPATSTDSWPALPQSSQWALRRL